jgi:hypothetical protein
MKYLGLILLVVGLGLIGISKFTTYEVAKKTSTYHEVSNDIGDNKLTEFGGTEVQKTSKSLSDKMNEKIDEKAKPYEDLASIEMTLGIALAILGLAITMFFKKRKS